MLHLFFQQVRRLGFRVTMVKVKSHFEVADAIHGHVLLSDLAEKAMADSIAKAAAAAAQVNEKVATAVKIGKAATIKTLMHIVRANLEYLRQLEAGGYRDPSKQPAKSTGTTKRVQASSARGHCLQRTGVNIWRCQHCLAVRRSTAARRWPQKCSLVFRQISFNKPSHLAGGISESAGAGADLQEVAASKEEVIKHGLDDADDEGFFQE